MYASSIIITFSLISFHFQMTHDTSKETMAQIRMTIDLADEENQKAENSQPNANVKLETALDDQHWAFRAPQKLVSTMTAIRDCFWIDKGMRKNFDSKLPNFVHKHFPSSG